MAQRHQKTLLAFLAFVLVGFSVLQGSVPGAEANVSLTSFEVQPGDNDTSLKIIWQTQSETDMVGFRVKRSTTPSVDQTTDLAPVQSTGTATTGDDYQVVDQGLTKGQTYYYWLYEIKNDNTESALSADYKSGIPGGQVLPTNTPTNTPNPTATLPSGQQRSTATPTAMQTATSKPTATVPSSTATSVPSNTPITSQGVTPTTIPTTPVVEAAATSTPLPQSNNSSGNSPAVATSTPLPTPPQTPLAQTQFIGTPVAAVSTAIVEGATPGIVAPTPEIKSDGTPGTASEAGTPATDQALQVPPTPTDVLDAASTDGSAASSGDETVEAAPQAVAQEAAPGGAAPRGRLARPTATPRPSTSADTSSDSGSLLLILGGASLCGAVVLALAALVVWRRR